MPERFTLQGGAITDTAIAAALSGGVSVTSAASANTKGAWVELVAATTHDAGWIVVTLAPISAVRWLVDIGVGASTAEKIILPDLYTDSPGSLNQFAVRSYAFPVSVAKGSRLSARCSAGAASVSIRVGMQLVAPTFLMGSLGGNAEACGITLATTRLTAIDPGAVAHTDSAAVQLIAATTFAYRWVIVTIGKGASAIATAGQVGLLDILIGAAGVEKVLIPDLYYATPIAVDRSSTVYHLPVPVPSGSRLSARVRSAITTATDRIVDVGLWGVG